MLLNLTVIDYNNIFLIIFILIIAHLFKQKHVLTPNEFFLYLGLLNHSCAMGER